MWVSWFSFTFFFNFTPREGVYVNKDDRNCFLEMLICVMLAMHKVPSEMLIPGRRDIKHAFSLS